MKKNPKLEKNWKFSEPNYPILFNSYISLFLNLSASSVNKLKSPAQVSIPVEVKFVNRARQEVQLEWITPQGRREKKKVLRKGRCWRTTSWEGHYWVCCDPKHNEHLFALNYGLHYRVQKTRRARERVVITAGKENCLFQFLLGRGTVAWWLVR